MKEKINITINSTVIYIIAFLCTTVFHELGHAISGMVYHSEPTLHQHYVEHLSKDALPIHQQVILTAAGPTISLFQGLLAGLIFLKVSKQHLLDLFMLWLAILGLNNFFGYLMTGPFFKGGDIGKIFTLLHTPFWLQIVIALTAAVIIFYIAYQLTRPFLSFSYKSTWLESEKSRKQFAFNIIIVPWIVGSTIVTALYLPIVALISIIYPFSSGMIFIFPWQNAARVSSVSITKHFAIGQVSFSAIGILVILIIIFKFVLAPGIKFY